MQNLRTDNLKLPTENQNFYRICQNKSFLTKFAHSKEKLLTKVKFAHSKDLLIGLAHRICFQQRKIAYNEKTLPSRKDQHMATILASCKFEHSWCAQLTGLKLCRWNVLWSDLVPEHSPCTQRNSENETVPGPLQLYTELLQLRKDCKKCRWFLILGCLQVISLYSTLGRS